MWPSLARSWDSSVCIGRRRRRRSSQHRVQWGSKFKFYVNFDAKGFFKQPPAFIRKTWGARGSTWKTHRNQLTSIRLTAPPEEFAIWRPRMVTFSERAGLPRSLRKSPQRVLRCRSWSRGSTRQISGQPQPSNQSSPLNDCILIAKNWDGSHKSYNGACKAYST